MTVYVRRIVNLEETDYWTVQKVARENSLGGKVFSAALHLIIREWREGKPEYQPPPSPANDSQDF